MPSANQRAAVCITSAVKIIFADSESNKNNPLANAEGRGGRSVARSVDDSNTMGKKSQESKQVEKVALEVSVSPVADGGWGWFVCLAGFVAQFIILGIQNNTGILYTALLDEYKKSKLQTAWVLSIGLGMMFLFAPVTSTLCERFGSRKTAILGGFLSIAGFISSSFVSELYVLYLTFGLLWGIGASMSYLPTLTTLPYWFYRRIGLSNGIVTAGSGVGTIAMGPVMQLLISYLGWAHTARVLGGLMCLCTLAAILYRIPRKPEEKSVEKSATTEKENGKPIFDFSVFKNKAFVVWCFSLSAFMMGYFVPFVHLPAYAELCGIPNSQSSTLIGMMSVGSTVGRLFFGKIGDHPKVNRLYLCQMAFLCIGVANTLSTLTKSYAGLSVYMVVFGLFDGCFVVLLGVVCADVVGLDKVAAGMGVQFFFMAITSIAGPPLAGMIYDLAQSYEIAFLAAGGTSIVATCLLFLVPVFMPVEEITYSMDLQTDKNQSVESEKTIIITCSSPDSADANVISDNRVSRSFLRPSLETGVLRGSTSYLGLPSIPKRASMGSMMGSMMGLNHVHVPTSTWGERLVVVERVSQV